VTHLAPPTSSEAIARGGRTHHHHRRRALHDVVRVARIVSRRTMRRAAYLIIKEWRVRCFYSHDLSRSSFSLSSLFHEPIPTSHQVPTRSDTVPTVRVNSSHKLATLWELVGTFFGHDFQPIAVLRGDVFSNFFARRDVSGSLRGLCHRGCFRDGPAVTIRSLSLLISTRPKFFKALAIPVGMTWDAIPSLSQGAKILSMA
jgi:hypothetical protein